MRRRDAVEALTAACRKAGAISVATMQAVPVWHRVAPDPGLHADMMGCMGSASSFALGLALGAPGRAVVVADGDGCLMMQLGTLVTIGQAAPANFTLVVMNNGTYETSGNQPIPGAQTADFAALALAAGFRAAHRVDDAAVLAAQLASWIAAPGPTMIVLALDREEPATEWPAISMKQQIQDLRAVFMP
jgi:thiamine pyrophosphate-dependent acetolactate synthase large subunit-like protein